MEIKMAAKKQITGGFLALTLFVLVIAACSNLASKTPTPITPTKLPEITSYQFVLEKSLGRGIVEAVDWAPDGNSFALATSLGVDVYDAETLEIAQTFATEQWNEVIAYSPDSKLLAVAAADGKIQVWDITSRRLIYKLTPTGIHPMYGNPPVLVFSHDGQILASSLYQTLYLWDLNTGELLDSFPGYVDGIYSVAFSPDGKFLLAAGHNQIYVRSVPIGDLLYPPIELQDQIVGLFFEQDNMHFATVSSQFLSGTGATGARYESIVRSWDLLTGKMLNERLATDSNIRLIDVNSMQSQIVLGEEYGISIWDAPANKVTFSMQGQTSWLTSIALSPEGGKLLFASHAFVNKYVQLWDLASRQILKSFDEYSPSPAEVAFSPNEKMIAIAGRNNIIQVREIHDGKLLHSLNGGAPLAFSPDSQIIAFATVEENNHIVLANAETGELLSNTNFSCSGVKALVFRPDGKTLAFGGDHCDLQFRNIQTGNLVSNLSETEGNKYLSFDQLLFSPDGKRLFLGGYQPKILDAQNGKILLELGTGYTSNGVLSPDGRYLALSGMGSYREKVKVQIWDVASNQIAFTVDTLQDDIYTMVFSPDGRLLVTVGQGMELWDLWSGTPLARLETSAAPLIGITFSADGRTLLAFGNDGSIQQWGIEPDPQMTLNSHPTPTAFPTVVITPPVPTMELTSVAELGRGYSSPVYRSSDGKLAAFVEENKLKWFDAVSLKQLGSIDIGEPFGEIIFSPDNKIAVVDSYAGAQIIDLEQRTIIGQLGGGYSYPFGYTFSKDGHFMAYNAGGGTTGGPYHGIGLWDLIEHKNAFADYHYFRTLLEDRYHTMSAPAISPDGTLVAAGHSDKRIYIWDLHSGKSHLILEGHAAKVTAVDFSPDGRALASGSLDGTIRLWDPSTGKLIKVLTGFKDDISDIRFTPDGRGLKVSVAEQPEQSIALDTGKINPIQTPVVTANPLELQQYQRGFSTETGNIFSQVIFSPDGSMLALVSQNVLLWDVATQKLLAFLDNSAGGTIRGITFNSDGTLLAVTTSDDHVLVWDVKTGKQIFHQKSSFLFGTTVIAGFGDSDPGLARGSSIISEQGLAFSPEQDLLVFSNDNAIEVWDIRKSEKAAEFSNPEGLYATQFSFSEDSKRLYVVLNRNRIAQVWDTVSDTLIRQVDLTEVDPNAYTAVALHAPLFARNNSDDQGNNWIELWNLDEEEFIKINVPSSQNEPLLFSPDGSLLAARVTDSGINFWKTNTGEFLYQTEFGANGLAISTDNRLLAVGLDGRAKIYDLRPVSSLSLSEQRESPTAQPTPTPVTFVWPTNTPAPLPTQSAEDVTSDVIHSGNAPQIAEKARFGNGTIEHLGWAPTGDSIMTSGSLGVSQYSLHDFTKAWSESLQVDVAGWTYRTVYLRDGRILATGVDSGRVRVWDISMGNTLADLQGGGEPAISPDGSLLVYLDPEGPLQTWDIANGQPVASLKSYYPRSPVFSPDGKWVAAIQSFWRYADSVRVWNARTGEIVNALGGPDNDITDLSFSADGRFLVGAAGGSAWIWDLHPGAEPEEIQLYEVEINGNLNLYTHTVTAATLSPDHQAVIIGTSENDIWIYDRKTRQPIFQLKAHSSPIRYVSFSPDGKMLASVDEDGAVAIWDMASKQRIALLDDHKGPIAGLVYRTDGNLAAWGSGTAWQINAPDQVLQHATNIDTGKILAVSPAGDLLAAYNPFQVSLWDVKDSKFLQRLEGEAQEPSLHYRWEGMAFRQFYSAVFSRDGRYLATAGAGGVWYYDTASRNLIQQLPGSNAQKIAMSPDGNWLLTSLSEQDEPVVVYDVRDGSQVFTLDEYGWGRDYLQSIFSPDGRWVGTVKRGWEDPPELVIYDVASHQVYKRMPLGKDVVLTSLAFSPLESVVAVGTVDGEILLIDYSELKALAALTGHHATVEHLVFSPDGQYLISASIDGTIRTWGLP